MNSEIERAALFASQAHSGQVRKYTGRPYFTHVERVANTVNELPKTTERMVVAAYLHDVVEDTPVNIGDILATFGPEVSALVHQLTNVSANHPELNRKERKQLDREWLEASSHEAQVIKLVDRLDNLREMGDAPSGFKRKYAEESRLLVDAIGHAHPALAEAIMDETEILRGE